MLFSHSQERKADIDSKKWTQLEEAEVESTNTFGKDVFTKTEKCRGDIEIGDYLNAYEDKFAYFNQEKQLMLTQCQHHSVKDRLIKESRNIIIE